MFLCFLCVLLLLFLFARFHQVEYMDDICRKYVGCLCRVNNGRNQSSSRERKSLNSFHCIVGALFE